jgi:hypothetical protein
MYIVALRFSVERLEAVRDRLNPTLAAERRIDANLEELKAWRNRSVATRGAARGNG